MAKNIILNEEQLRLVIDRLNNRKINLSEEQEHEHYMAKQQLFTIATMAYKMWEMLEEGEVLEDWMESKIAQCDASITAVVKSFFYDDLKNVNSSDQTLDLGDLVIGT